MADEAYLDMMTEGRQAGARGQLDIACRLFLKAAAKAPQDAEILTGIANEIIKIKRFGKAHDVLLSAVEADPAYQPANLMLGNLYLYIGKPGLAAGCFESVLEKTPEDAEIWLMLGRALYENREIEKALAAFRKAFDLGNQTASNYYMILQALEVMNRLDEMAELLDEGLEKYPDNELMQIIKAKFDVRVGDYDGALIRLNAIKLEGREPNVAVTVYFAMGKALDKAGEPEKAFSAFSRANELRAKAFKAKNFVTGNSIRLVKDMNALDFAALESGPAADVGKSHPAPIFLVGFPRSGTTLLNRILDSHPDIETMEERPLLYMIRTQLMDTFGEYPALLNNLEKNDLNATRAKYMGLAKTIGHIDPSKVIVDKLPLNIIHIPLIIKLFPDARFILSLRHPCGACLSCFMQNFAENNDMANFLDLETTTRFYADVMTLWHKFLKHLPIKYHQICYEDVVENLENEAKKLISFLGLPWDEQVLAYRERALEKGFINTPSYHQVVQPLYSDSLERWRRYDTYLAPYKKRLEPFIEYFGYKA